MMKKVQRLLILVLALCLALCGCKKESEKKAGSSWEDAVSIYFQAMTGDADAMMKCIPDTILNATMERANQSRKELKADLEESAKYTRNNLEAYYGKSLKITPDIHSKEKLSKDDLASIQDELNSLFEVKMSISEGYVVTGEYTLQGQDKKNAESFELLVLKIDGKWCVDPSEL